MRRTKQGDAVLACLKAHGGEHRTAMEIVAELNAQGEAVGVATVYRQLEKLVESQLARKYVVDERTGACYQYAGEREDCAEHFHLKCSECGKLIHTDCEFLEDLRSHVAEHHSFTIDSAKTVLYGRCEACAKAEEKK